MGRTNPTYRDLLRRTAERWETFRRGLRRDERRRFDELWEHAHRHADASGLLNHPDPIVPALFSMALEHQRRIDELGARLDAIEGEAGDGTGAESGAGADGAESGAGADGAESGGGADGADAGDR